MTTKPLAGIKVLDLTRFFAGPFCTMLLGDLGADVVKIETAEGDPIRHQGPPFHKEHSFSFLAVNRNKRSIVLDMKSPEGRATARQLALASDVIVENFRPGVMDRLGLGYEALAAENPKLVYAAMSGMGADGPDKDMGAFDLTIQAMGGYMSLTGERDGAPVKLGTSAFDLITGQYAANGVITALLARERTGLGQKVETSLLESEVTFLVDAAMEYLTTGALRRKWGSEHANVVPYKAFQGADGWVIIGAGHQNLFEKFLKVLGRTELLADPRFATDAARVANRDAVYEVMDAEVARWTVAELVDRLNAENVPCAPVNDMEQVFTHRQVLHRGMLQRLEHPQYGEVPTIGPAVKYGAFDIASGWTAPPLVGEHTADILGEWLGEGGAGARPAAAPGG